MADDMPQNDKGQPEEEEQQPKQEDFGALTEGEGEDDTAGNLPPLSSLDSSADSGFDSDMSLPPLGSLDFESSAEDSSGGLPPVEELSVQEPTPTGGAIKPPPPGFEAARRGEGPETEPATPAAESGFQDLSADSHFPEVSSEISPGPDSDMETPMFDSAFGGDDINLGGEMTPAPTQTVDTPLFDTTAETPAPGGAEAGLAFDEGAFDLGEGEAFEAGGTPMPDFSQDTGMPPEAAPMAEAEEVPMERAKPARGGGPGVLVTVGIGLAAVIIGIIGGPFVAAKLSFLPNPTAKELQAAQEQVAMQQRQITKLTQAQQDREGPALTPEQIDEMIEQRDGLQAAIDMLTTQHDEAGAKFNSLRDDLAMITEEIEAKNEEYVETQDHYEELVNETSIVRARHMGLRAEVDRLTGQVGELEDADARRLASKEALEHDIERLAVAVKEGIPLTPEKYARSARLAAVEELKAKAEAAKWVTPELLKAYTELYQREMEIASTKSYFFANIPVTDRLGSMQMKWAECLMIGNWAVYYRTLDGKNIGIYEDVAESGPPRYAFREGLEGHVKKMLESQIFDSRVEDYEAKVKVLAQKQSIRESETSFQQAYNSL